MINLILDHKKETDYQTLGLMEVLKDGVFQFTLATLELPWRNNKRNVSRIWNKVYIVDHFDSVSHPNCFLLRDTKPRTGILIHIVNYVQDLLGCIGVGLTHTDINRDGKYDLAHSREALDKLRAICKNEEYILLTIK